MSAIPPTPPPQEIYQGQLIRSKTLLLGVTYSLHQNRCVGAWR